LFARLILLTRLINRANKYAWVYIYRDAFFFGTFFERWLKRKKVKIIYDFDDAIWLMDKNPNQGIFNKLKNPEKTAEICKLADRVIVGNKYLADFASQYCNDVRIIPSTIDFDSYQEVHTKENERVCIGWTGSFSTIKHFETVLPALEEVKQKFGERIYFKIIGDPTFSYEPLNIQGVEWKSETEVKDLSELDIGLMSLPDNEWTQGKCAMKGLQYMALEIPTIMSPVGVNSDIIEDGTNGFLASATEEWVEKLSLLIEDPKLRKKMGQAGKMTVEKDYSVEANKEKWLKAFRF
ncbi:MAG: glycosyltransferase family 4 protein, partial [Bacteroidota bacterium]